MLMLICVTCRRLLHPRKPVKSHVFRQPSTRLLRSSSHHHLNSSQHQLSSSSSHDHASGPSPVSTRHSETRLRKTMSASQLDGDGWEKTRAVFRKVTKDILRKGPATHQAELYRLLYKVDQHSDPIHSSNLN
eukprot:TRINITY_DN10590_c0_g1_i6.p1 TRINITY_DN10590_c0_g1~~TRINITY_DN10590_c0_g1_i6.p1  ORF type:complete len:132 (+),score=6.88 TRINITY_DN10590_c0_g1_i6:130-525(+)